MVSPHEQVAIKKMEINRKNKEEYLVIEISIMKTCHHPNIVRYIDSYRVEDCIWVIARPPFSPHSFPFPSYDIPRCRW